MQVDQCVRSCSSINNKIISFKNYFTTASWGPFKKKKKIRGPWARAQCAHLLRRLWAGHRRRVPAAAGALSSKCGSVMLIVERRDSIFTLAIVAFILTWRSPVKSLPWPANANLHPVQSTYATAVQCCVLTAKQLFNVVSWQHDTENVVVFVDWIGWRLALLGYRVTSRCTPFLDKSQLSQTDPRDALRHDHRTVQKVDAQCGKQTTVVGGTMLTTVDVPWQNYSKFWFWDEAPGWSTLDFLIHEFFLTGQCTGEVKEASLPKPIRSVRPFRRTPTCENYRHRQTDINY